MPSIDEQLRERIRGSAPSPAGADNPFVRLGERKRRRATARKLGTVGLVVAVLAGTVGGFVALERAFRTNPTPAGPPPSVANGALVVSIPNEGSYHLMILPPERQDLDPTDGTTTAGFDSMERLTWVGGTQDTESAVSPDGNTVAFVRKDSTDVPPSLWLIDIDGTHERQVTRAPADVKSPAWSPDGSMIAFSAANEPHGRALYTIHPDGSDLHMVASGPLTGGLAWSPDGTSIVFDDIAGPSDPSDLFIASANGRRVDQLTSTREVSEIDPTWSPDGRTIAFATADGIEEISADGGTSRVVVPTSPDGQVPSQPAWSPDGTYLTFVFDPSSVVYVLPAGATDPFPVVQGASFAWQPVPVTSPTPSVENLGFDFPVCRVMSMPITIAGTPRTAYVVSKATGGCPAPGEGHRFAGVDVDGDGAIDANVELHGCYPPVGCEAFAAPDVNGDGTSEIATSEAGADGYGVSLYEVIPPATWSPLPAILPIDVVDRNGIGNLQTGPLQFAWVDVAGHTEGARCDVTASGTTLSIYGYDKMGAETDVRTTTLSIEPTSATATVTDASSDRMPLDQAPVPRNELCAAPLQGSAANFPNATDASGLDIGIEAPLCDESKIVADFTGDGQKDTAWVGVEAHNGRCSTTGDDTGIVAIDDNGDGLADGSYASFPHCFECRTFAASDLDADGVPELIVLVQGSATPTFEIYEAIRGANVEPPDGVVPVTTGTDVQAMGLTAGDPVTLTAGGDEGSSFAIGCEGFPSSPVLVQWNSYSPIEGPGSDVRDVYVTKLRLSAGVATVIDSQHTSQPSSDPPLFDGLHSTGCGVRWFP
jgi:hypothetical protein